MTTTTKATTECAGLFFPFFYSVFFLFRANTLRQGGTEEWRVAYGVLALLYLAGWEIWSGLAFGCWLLGPLAVFILTFAADPRVHTFGQSNAVSFLGC